MEAHVSAQGKSSNMQQTRNQDAVGKAHPERADAKASDQPAIFV